jgi:hypothetical protein
MYELLHLPNRWMELFSTALNFGTIVEVLSWCHVLFCLSNILLLQSLKMPINTQTHKSKEIVFYCKITFWNIFFILYQALKECLWFCLLVVFVHALIITFLPSLALKNELIDFSHLRTATSDVKYCFCTSLSLCLSNLHSM